MKLRTRYVEEVWIDLIDRQGGESWLAFAGDDDDRDPDWSPWLRRLGDGEDPAFSPDGKRVVVTSLGAGLSVFDLAGRSRLLPRTRTATDPAWQPVPR